MAKTAGEIYMFHPRSRFRKGASVGSGFVDAASLRGTFSET
jgi:hypothetical protein